MRDVREKRFKAQAIIFFRLYAINFGIKVQSLARFLDHFAIPFSSHTVFDEKNIDLALHLTANTIHIGCFGDPTDDASSFDEYQ